MPFRYFFHALNVLRGKSDDPNAPGEITHFQALSTALASTIGMGNIAGVAVAIHIGRSWSYVWDVDERNNWHVYKILYVYVGYYV